MGQYEIWNKFIPTANPEAVSSSHSMCSHRTRLPATRQVLHRNWPYLSTERLKAFWCTDQAGSTAFRLLPVTPSSWMCTILAASPLFSSVAPNAETVPYVRPRPLRSYYQSFDALKSALLTASLHKYEHECINKTQVRCQPSAGQFCAVTQTGHAVHTACNLLPHLFFWYRTPPPRAQNDHSPH
jgi:hypothetical protein